jgi:hypothetical protein
VVRIENYLVKDQGYVIMDTMKLVNKYQMNLFQQKNDVRKSKTNCDK